MTETRLSRTKLEGNFSCNQIHSFHFTQKDSHNPSVSWAVGKIILNSLGGRKW
ncbi:MAG: hypothetical protein KJ600_01495 [Nanoarchaeota archaeon]|nr:hypothetical protein [Nanoarchaeota archaeon]MBU1103214.1 hypothetical protein [Nanoarchaeota archaeon]